MIHEKWYFSNASHNNCTNLANWKYTFKYTFRYEVNILSLYLLLSLSLTHSDPNINNVVFLSSNSKNWIWFKSISACQSLTKTLTVIGASLKIIAQSLCLWFEILFFFFSWTTYHTITRTCSAKPLPLTYPSLSWTLQQGHKYAPLIYAEQTNRAILNSAKGFEPLSESVMITRHTADHKIFCGCIC